MAHLPCAEPSAVTCTETSRIFDEATNSNAILFFDEADALFGDIRNIIVSAAYLASANGGQVTMKHLLHSTP